MSENRNYRQRTEEELRDALQRLINAAWKKEFSPAPFTIPADEKRDVDCILWDGIDELISLRARIAELEKQINNFLSYGQGGASFNEAQWIEKLRQQEECAEKAEDENKSLRAQLAEAQGQVGMLQKALEELVFAPIVFDDERLDYVEVQVGKASLEDALEVLSQTAQAEKPLEIHLYECGHVWQKKDGQVPESCPVCGQETQVGMLREALEKVSTQVGAMATSSGWNMKRKIDAIDIIRIALSQTAQAGEKWKAMCRVVEAIKKLREAKKKTYGCGQCALQRIRGGNFCWQHEEPLIEAENELEKALAALERSETDGQKT
jgi:uncharacterized Zn finger protein (UPF0148 family)